MISLVCYVCGIAAFFLGAADGDQIVMWLASGLIFAGWFIHAELNGKDV